MSLYDVSGVKKSWLEVVWSREIEDDKGVEWWGEGWDLKIRELNSYKMEETIRIDYIDRETVTNYCSS